MRHTRARNVIERAFRIVKIRWGILRSASYYPIRTQVRLIMACFLLHNFVRKEMVIDPLDARLDREPVEPPDGVPPDDFIASVEATPEWTAQRDLLAHAMWVEYTSGAWRLI